MSICDHVSKNQPRPHKLYLIGYLSISSVLKEITLREGDMQKSFF